MAALYVISVTVAYAGGVGCGVTLCECGVAG